MNNEIKTENVQYLIGYYTKIYRNLTFPGTPAPRGKKRDKQKRKVRAKLKKLIAEERFQPDTLGLSRDAHIRAESLAKSMNVYGTQNDKYDFYEQIKLLAKADCEIFMQAYPSFEGSFKSFFMGEKGADRLMRRMPLLDYYRNYYLVKVIKGDISKLIPPSPEMQYPEARNMERKFYLHIGPTNAGKTFHAIERLKSASCGLYLGPLRLLALEIYDKMTEAGIPCSMITGEEEIFTEGAVVTASTIELLNMQKEYDIAVIDEAQMLKDPSRGYNWTRAILGTCAREIHICMAPEAEAVVLRLIRLCGDTYQINRHQRCTELEFLPEPFSLDACSPGDALIVFSKKAVLRLSACLEERHIKNSIIYGNLPPAARKEQIHKFTSGETEVIVSTDAIGMGVNLPIRRVIFMETEKFDGKRHRLLHFDEIRQIAGRAGRYGLYENGYVQTVSHPDAIGEALTQPVENLTRVYAGFSEVLLDIPAEIPSIFAAWEKIRQTPPFRMMPMKEQLSRYHILERVLEQTVDGRRAANFDKKEIYNLITCPFDTREKAVLDLWIEYALSILVDRCTTLRFPVLEEYDRLQALESHYKCLDLYHQVSTRFGLAYEKQGLYSDKKAAVERINEILLLPKQVTPQDERENENIET